MPLGVIASNFAMIAEEIKAGRQSLEGNEKLVALILETAKDLGSTEPIEAKDDQPEPALKSTSLDLLKLKTRRLQLAATQL
jgi:hypothetical protein